MPNQTQVYSFASIMLVIFAGVSPRISTSVPKARARISEIRLPTSIHAQATVASSQSPLNMQIEECPSFTFPDHGVCVRVPENEQWSEDPVGAPEVFPQAAGHFEKSGRWQTYEQIPRRPDRPEDYDVYEYPIPPGLPNGHSVVSGYDLHLPDELQRRGRGLKSVGHGAVDLPQKRGTPIKLIALEHQVGDAEIVYVGTLMGFSVVTKHTLREGGRARDYVVIFGHLEGADPGLVRGLKVRAGEVIGFVGDTGSPGIVHLHLEARRVRDGVDVLKISSYHILLPSMTIVCDPRNVLPIRKY